MILPIWFSEVSPQVHSELFLWLCHAKGGKEVGSLPLSSRWSFGDVYPDESMSVILIHKIIGSWQYSIGSIDLNNRIHSPRKEDITAKRSNNSACKTPYCILFQALHFGWCSFIIRRLPFAWLLANQTFMIGVYSKNICQSSKNAICLPSKMNLSENIHILYMHIYLYIYTHISYLLVSARSLQHYND